MTGDSPDPHGASACHSGAAHLYGLLLDVALAPLIYYAKGNQGRDNSGISVALDYSKPGNPREETPFHKLLDASLPVFIKDIQSSA